MGSPKRNLRLWLTCSLVSGVGAFYLSSSVSSRVRAAGIPVPSPVTAHYTIEQYDPTGALGLRKARLYARFSDGTIVNKYDELYPKPGPMIMEVMDPIRGDHLFLDCVTSSVTSLRRGPAREQKTIDESDTEGGCPSAASLGRLLPVTMLGVKTVYFAVKEEDGDIEREKWMAPELRCLPLKEIDTSSWHKGAHNIMTATSVAIGEPALELKTIPNGYVERDPETVEALHIAATGGDPFWGSLLLRALKRDYVRIGKLNSPQ